MYREEEVSQISWLFVTKPIILVKLLIVTSLLQIYYMKPARSINFISLNFIATKTGVAFSEVVERKKEKKMANINDFKAVMKGGGASANQFQVTVTFPVLCCNRWRNKGNVFPYKSN